MEQERDEIRALLAESGKQLDFVRRQVIALETKGSAHDSGKLILRSDHALLLRKREDELLADMKTQFPKGHAEMQRQIGEAVESAGTGLKADLARAEGDRQCFVNSIAEAMQIEPDIRVCRL